MLWCEPPRGTGYNFLRHVRTDVGMIVSCATNSGAENGANTTLAFVLTRLPRKDHRPAGGLLKMLSAPHIESRARVAEVPDMHVDALVTHIALVHVAITHSPSIKHRARTPVSLGRRATGSRHRNAGSLAPCHIGSSNSHAHTLRHHHKRVQCFVI